MTLGIAIHTGLNAMSIILQLFAWNQTKIKHPTVVASKINNHARYVLFNSFIFQWIMWRSIFALGGSTRIALYNAVVDILFHDTYYVMAHFHLVMALTTTDVILFSRKWHSQYFILGRLVYNSSRSNV